MTNNGLSRSCQRRLSSGYSCGGGYCSAFDVPGLGRIDLCPKHYVEAQMLHAPVDKRPRVERAPATAQIQSRFTVTDEKIKHYRTKYDRLLRTLALVPESVTAAELSSRLWEPVGKTTAALTRGVMLGQVERIQGFGERTKAKYKIVAPTPK